MDSSADGTGERGSLAMSRDYGFAATTSFGLPIVQREDLDHSSSGSLLNTGGRSDLQRRKVPRVRPALDRLTVHGSWNCGVS